MQGTTTAEERIAEWRSGKMDAETLAEIDRLEREDPEELIDAFSATLKFGTGGIRARMGPGTNRLNRYTIRIITLGIVRYLERINCKGPLLIGYDSRHHSRGFALTAAQVLAAAGRPVYLCSALRPSPLISFGVRHLQCAAGIMITASHNPPTDNGYKVYWSDGAQVLPPHDRGIVEEIAAIESGVDIAESSAEDPLIQQAGAELDEAYLQAISSGASYPAENHREGQSLSLVYSPLHGTGITLLPEALHRWGFTQLHILTEQAEPNGDFPTLHLPNPEEPEALRMGSEAMLRQGADLFLATDPDADRVGVVIHHEGKAIPLTGNQTAALAIHHLCSAYQGAEEERTSPAFIKTVVTSELCRAIAEAYDFPCFDVLTGFKYIGERIEGWASNPDSPYFFLFGAEESYGYLLGTHARDKDALITSCLIAEAALHAKRMGRTLVDQLYRLYEVYGIYREGLSSLSYPGLTGAKKIAEMINRLRKDPPKEIGGAKVLLIQDYKEGVSLDLQSNNKEPLELPSSNLLLYKLEDETKLVIRPSGTEPKVKLYGGVILRRYQTIAEGIAEADALLHQRLKAFQKLLGLP